MGLDTTHGAWNGGYGSFNLWRQCIANYYGVPLELMEGYWSMSGSAECLIKDKMGTASWFDKYERVLPLKWESFKLPNSVKYLLNHSDCDGHIPPKTCGKLAKELNKALPNLKSMFPRWTDEEIQKKTRKFADGCNDAFLQNEKLGFH